MKNNLLSLIKSRTEIRFLLVGAWNTLFGYLVFLLFLFLLENIFNNERQIYSLSIAFSHLISVINSFIFHKVVTFVSKQKGLKIVYEFRRFFNSYIITFLLNLSLISIQVELLSLSPRIAGAISLPIVTVVTFFLLSKYAFNETQNRKEI